MAELARLAARLDHAANGGLKQAVIARGAGTLAELTRAGFDASRRPTGGAWRRLKHPRARSRPNRGGPLFDSGKLREEASTVQITPDGWLIAIDAPGAAAHLYGAPSINLPARPFLPIGNLPARWRREMARQAAQTLRQQIGP
jgi:phage gpG-like protein